MIKGRPFRFLFYVALPMALAGCPTCSPEEIAAKFEAALNAVVGEGVDVVATGTPEWAFDKRLRVWPPSGSILKAPSSGDLRVRLHVESLASIEGDTGPITPAGGTGRDGEVVRGIQLHVGAQVFDAKCQSTCVAYRNRFNGADIFEVNLKFEDAFASIYPAIPADDSLIVGIQIGRQAIRLTGIPTELNARIVTDLNYRRGVDATPPLLVSTNATGTIKPSQPLDFLFSEKMGRASVYLEALNPSGDPSGNMEIFLCTDDCGDGVEEVGRFANVLSLRNGRLQPGESYRAYVISADDPLPLLTFPPTVDLNGNPLADVHRFLVTAGFCALINWPIRFITFGLVQNFWDCGDVVEAAMTTTAVHTFRAPMSMLSELAPGVSSSNWTPHPADLRIGFHTVFSNLEHEYPYRERNELVQEARRQFLSEYFPRVSRPLAPKLRYLGKAAGSVELQNVAFEVSDLGLPELPPPYVATYSTAWTEGTRLPLGTISSNVTTRREIDLVRSEQLRSDIESEVGAWTPFSGYQGLRILGTKGDILDEAWFFYERPRAVHRSTSDFLVHLIAGLDSSGGPTPYADLIRTVADIVLFNGAADSPEIFVNVLIQRLLYLDAGTVQSVAAYSPDKTPLWALVDYVRGLVSAYGSVPPVGIRRAFRCEYFAGSGKWECPSLAAVAKVLAVIGQHAKDYARLIATEIFEYMLFASGAPDATSLLQECLSLSDSDLAAGKEPCEGMGRLYRSVLDLSSSVAELSGVVGEFAIEWGVESRDRQFKDLLKRALDSYCFETGPRSASYPGCLIDPPTTMRAECADGSLDTRQAFSALGDLSFWQANAPVFFPLSENGQPRPNIEIEIPAIDISRFRSGADWLAIRDVDARSWGAPMLQLTPRSEESELPDALRHSIAESREVALLSSDLHVGNLLLHASAEFRVSGMRLWLVRSVGLGQALCAGGSWVMAEADSAGYSWNVPVCYDGVTIDSAAGRVLASDIAMLVERPFGPANDSYLVPVHAGVATEIYPYSIDVQQAPAVEFLSTWAALALTPGSAIGIKKGFWATLVASSTLADTQHFLIQMLINYVTELLVSTYQERVLSWRYPHGAVMSAIDRKTSGAVDSNLNRLISGAIGGWEAGLDERSKAELYGENGTCEMRVGLGPFYNALLGRALDPFSGRSFGAPIALSGTLVSESGNLSGILRPGLGWGLR